MAIYNKIYMPEFLRIYKLLIEQFLAGGLTAEEFSRSYMILFLQEKSGMSEAYFTVLQDLFEDSDSYSPMWTKSDEEQYHYRITAPTLLEEARTTLSELDDLVPFEKSIKSGETALQVVTEVQEQNKDLDMSEDELLDFVNEAVHEVRTQTKHTNMLE